MPIARPRLFHCSISNVLGRNTCQHLPTLKSGPRCVRGLCLFLDGKKMLACLMVGRIVVKCETVSTAPERVETPGRLSLPYSSIFIHIDPYSMSPETGTFSGSLCIRAWAGFGPQNIHHHHNRLRWTYVGWPCSLQRESLFLNLYHLYHYIILYITNTLPSFKHVRCNPYVAPRRNQKWPKYIIVHSTYIIYYITYKSEGVAIFDPLGRYMKISWCYDPCQRVVRGGGGFWSLNKISSCSYYHQHISQRGWQIWIPLRR